MENDEEVIFSQNVINTMEVVDYLMENGWTTYQQSISVRDELKILDYHYLIRVPIVDRGTVWGMVISMSPV